MPRGMHKLTALRVKNEAKVGYHGDGGGLWLQVARNGGRSWIFRYTRHGRTRHMGLGPVLRVSLADARKAAAIAWQAVYEGRDPIDERQQDRAAAVLSRAKAMTFQQCAEAYIDAHKAGWKNVKHAAQWAATLETYAYPHIGALPVSEVDTALVMKVLQPIWTQKTETASRLRGRIERILGWATVSEYRQGDNPARWNGHLQALLPKRGDIRKVVHHAALPYGQAGAFIADLRQRGGVAAKALEFAILTAARSGEVRGARWQEIDLTARMWVIPAERMKMKREHRVPLSDTAMAVLTGLPRLAGNDLVFPAPRGTAMSDMSLTAVLKRMGRSDLTAHGFRSTFSDWRAEMTAYPSEMAEMALAHAVADRVEAAYRRGDLLEKRRRMMNDWAAFCDNTTHMHGSNIVPMREAV